jgi:(p)ppGpp synthase/HD superfamily hydrolase
MDLIDSPHVYLTDRFFKAMAYAADAHKEQVRKSTNIAYISHPFGVAALVLEAGGDEDQAIGGLLHDVAEDCGGEPRLIEIAALFGDRVAHIVRGCSDSLVVDEELKLPWESRKQEHLQHLGSADADILLVSAADKTHNARAIATDIQSIGDQVWERFNADQSQILWYYRSLLRLFTTRDVTPVLLNPLGAAITVMDKSPLIGV